MTVKQILQSIDWPEETLVLDFETFFSTEYQMGKSKNALSIVEYVTDPRFEFTGLGIKIENFGSIFTTNVSWAVERLQNKFGKALHNITVVSQNNKFDMLILAEKFGIYPPYTIDILDLSRYYDARMSHKLADLSKMFGLESKGDTDQFKGQHWHQINYQDMKKYCLGDVENEYKLLEILLPSLNNVVFELDLARHTLALYLKPSIDFDLALAEQIKDGMDQALKDDLDKVAWVLNG